jgi:hypothetical protein
MITHLTSLACVCAVEKQSLPAVAGYVSLQASVSGLISGTVLA